MKSKNIYIVLRYIILIFLGLLMMYPLVWMISATFKNNNEIFNNLSLIPLLPTFDAYKSIMNNYGGKINLLIAIKNTYFYIIPKILFTLFSSVITAYGFSRFKFCGKKIFFILLMASVFLPDTITTIPQFIMYNKFGWIDSPFYLALIVPSFFAYEGYFVFMLMQFMKGLPLEMDEAARIDGCNSIQVLYYVICPIIRPAIVSCAVFQFIWSSNDFINPLLYIDTPSRYTLSIFVKLSMDADSGFEWNRVLAISLISIIPSLIVFFISQKNFKEGMISGAVKG